MIEPTHTAYDAVQDFHTKFGHLIGSRQQPDVKIPFKVVLLRQRLILEELAETAVALHEGKELEFIDGLCDLSYVVLGTAVSFGIVLPDMFARGISADLKRPAGRYLRPDHLPELNVLALGELTKVVGSLFQSVSTFDLRSTAEHLRELQYRLCRTAEAYRFPFRECFFEVHRANMSKTSKLTASAADGAKYGDKTPKGSTFVPPDHSSILYTPEA